MILTEETSLGTLTVKGAGWTPPIEEVAAKESEEIDLGIMVTASDEYFRSVPISSRVGTAVFGDASASDLTRVYNLLDVCMTTEEIVSQLKLSKASVLECINILKSIGVVVDDAGRHCGFIAVKNLIAQFDELTY